jgi:hypothetical protein
VVSAPEVAAAIINLASTTLDNTGTHATPSLQHYTLNQKPLAITVLDSSTAPPF